MKTVLALCLVGLLLFPAAGVSGEECVPRSELRDKHVVTYLAYNGTLRGCLVSPNFYTQQHKMNRGNLSRKFIIEICEGEPRTSPRAGDSFEICPYGSHSQDQNSK